MQAELHVYHDFAAAARTLAGSRYPIDRHRESYEYSLFQNAMQYLWWDNRIDLSMRKHCNRGWIVNLSGTLSSEAMKKAFLKVLETYNSFVPGLALVAMPLLDVKQERKPDERIISLVDNGT